MKKIFSAVAAFFLLMGVAQAQDIRSYCNTVSKASVKLMLVLTDNPGVTDLTVARRIANSEIIEAGASREQVILIDARFRHAEDLILRHAEVLKRQRTIEDLGRLVGKYCIAEGRMY